MKVYICVVGERGEGKNPYAAFADREAALKQIKADATKFANDLGLDWKVEPLGDGYMVACDVYQVKEFEVL